MPETEPYIHLSPEEVQDLEIGICRELPEYHFSRHFWIKDKQGQVRPLGNLKIAQKKTIALLRYLRKLNLPARIVIAKSRKQGESTIIAADCLDEVMQRQLDAIIIAHDKSTSQYLFTIYDRFYKNYDLPKPPLYGGKQNKREMRFEAPHDGRIEVETANNLMAGTGRTPQYIHASESAKWERGEQTLTSLLQSIGDKPGTTVIHESTFNGQEATFLPIWEAAVLNSELRFGVVPSADDPDGWEYKVHFEVTNAADWNHYIPLFISVLDDEDARLPFSSDEHRERFLRTLDEYERNLLEQYSASPEFLNWRRYTKKHKCQDSEEITKQEYPCTWQEGVRASGRPRFDLTKLDSQPIEEGEKGYLRQAEKWSRKIEWLRDPGEHLVRFRPPQPNHRYVIGADIAEGILAEGSLDKVKPDASVAIVLDLDRGGEQVATYAGQISEEHMVEPIRLLAEYYNLAFVVVESNSTGKHVCIELAKVYPAERLYHRDDWDPSKTRHSREVGWRTTIGNRGILIGKLATAILDNALLLHDRRTVLECKRFVWKDKGRVEAATGYHDNHCFALGLAVIGMECYPVHLQKDRRESALAERKQRERMQTRGHITGY